MKVVVSNGTYRFHLAPLASELEKRGALSALLTGGYPKGFWAEWIGRIPQAGLQRLLARREDLPDSRVHAFNATELCFKAADMAFGGRSGYLQQKLQEVGFRGYARQATRVLKRTPFDIYHYRNCFGFDSAAYARSAGKKTICDHSIGHPHAVSYLRHQKGFLLPESLAPQPLSPLESLYLEDFQHADHILVNSDFVKRTFTICGYDPTKLSVVHWGVDARFLEASDHALKRGLPRKPALDLLFCGGFGQRKGALQLMNALALADDMPWTLTIAGGIEADAQPAWADFITRYRHRVRHLGILPREELAGLMAQFRVFVFPTLMEGSARVVFEALASGCFVITTPHAGSVVEDQRNGLLLPPGDATLLAEAIRSLATGDRDLDGAGIMNRMLVRTSYRQDQYADKVLRVYEHVMSGQ